MKKLMFLTLALALLSVTAFPPEVHSDGTLCNEYMVCPDGQQIACSGYASNQACYSAAGCWIMCDGTATFCSASHPWDCPPVY